MVAEMALGVDVAEEGMVVEPEMATSVEVAASMGLVASLPERTEVLKG